MRVPGRGGGHSGTEWIPTVKQPRGAEAVNAKIWISFVRNFVLSIFDFSGRWSETLKKWGRVKENRGADRAKK